MKNPWDERTFMGCLILGAVALAFLVVMIFPAHGATGWTRTITASTRYVAASSASSDATGNSYVGVTYAGTVNFGSGPVAAVSNATDAAVVSYAPDGSLRWVSYITGPEFQSIYGVAWGDDGYVYVTGSYAGKMTVPDTVTAVGPGDTFVAKIHAPSGWAVWLRSYGSTADESGRAIGYRDGRICVAGVMYAAHSVGGPVLTPQGVDGWVGCYGAAEGAHLWSRTIGGVGADNAMSIAIDGAQSVYVGGRFTGTLPVAPYALTSAGGADTYVVKLHADGSPLWLVNPLPGHTLDDALTGLSSRDGRVAATGWTMPGAGRPTSLWLAQLSTSGATQALGEWGSSIAVSSLGTTGNAVAIDTAGNATAVGFTSGPVSFGGGVLDGPYTNDIVAVTYNGATYSGSTRWVATGAQSGQAVAYTSAGNAVIVANDGNNVVVTMLGDGTPPPTVPATSTPTAQATYTPTIQPTHTRTTVPTGTPTLTRTLSPRPTVTPPPAPTFTRTIAPPTNTAVPVTPSRSPSPKATATAVAPTATPTDLPACIVSNAPCVVEVRP